MKHWQCTFALILAPIQKAAFCDEGHFGLTRRWLYPEAAVMLGPGA
jgi:hypothetical protein